MENYNQLNKESKTQFWQKHFNLWEESELSQKRYCDENSVSYWSFKTWYSKLKPEIGAKKKNFIKLNPEKIINISSGKIEIFLTDEIKISLNEDISENNLKKILSALALTHDK